MNVEKPHLKVKIVAHGLTTSQMLEQMTMLPELMKSLTQVRKCSGGTLLT